MKIERRPKKYSLQITTERHQRRRIPDGWRQTVKGFGCGEGSNFPFPHWLASSPLQHSRTTMWVCDWQCRCVCVCVCVCTHLCVCLGSHWFVELQPQSSVEVSEGDLYQCVRRVHWATQVEGTVQVQYTVPLYVQYNDVHLYCVLVTVWVKKGKGSGFI